MSSLETYVYPRIGKVAVADIDLDAVMEVLEPIWRAKTETANRVRGGSNRFSTGTVSGYRSGDNPARWKGHLEHKLAKKSNIATVKHHPALPYREIAGFMAGLRSRTDDDAGLRALELAILTASRTEEVLQATWDEIRWEVRLWMIPARADEGQKGTPGAAQ